MVKITFGLCFFWVFGLCTPSVADEPGQTGSQARPQYHDIDAYPKPDYGINSLFYIQKNTNTSVVMFEAVRDANGEIDEDDPIHTYWIRYNEDSARGELNYIERKLAYGTTVTKLEKPGHYEFTVVAFKDKVFEMYKNDKNEIQVNTLIGKKMSRFHNVYLHLVNNLFIPSIDYIELFGSSLDTGQPVYEKVWIKK